MEKFILLDADKGSIISEFNPIPENCVIDLANLPTKNLSIMAKVFPDTIGSVIFDFDGNPVFNVEDSYPYTIAGDDNGHKYNGMRINSGWHKLTCTPFSGPKGQGLIGIPLSVSFKVINSLVYTPIVIAGENKLINWPENKITLEGFVEDNGLPDPPGKLITTWSILNSPGKVKIDKPESLITEVEFTFEGTYFFVLLANDGAEISADTLIVVVRTQPSLPGSLKDVQIPGPDKTPGFDFSQFVTNKDAAIKLGKILFWDMQAGSDGIQACASCHFHAGADSRTRNQINPGIDGISDGKYTVSRGPNYDLSESSFPFVKQDDDIVSSQGVFYLSFSGLVIGSSEEQGIPLQDSVFNIQGIKTRRVQSRNSPSVINAVYNYRNNWSGNAQPIFNGVSSEGMHDKNAQLLQVNGEEISIVYAAIPYSSLASQATAPAINHIEMSYQGRSFPQLGKKLLNLPPLAKQLVHPFDSQLGEYSNYPDKGLKVSISYDSLIRIAFHPRWWNSNKIITYSNGVPVISEKEVKEISNDQFKMIEANFPLFWGLSIQLYQSTLISDDTKYDKFREGRYDLSAREMRGLNLFLGKARCINCHSGSEFTNASVSNQKKGKLIDRMLINDTSSALYDVGFYNIGLRHYEEDPGEGTVDKSNIALSYSAQYSSGNITDTIVYNPENFTIPGEIKLNEKTAVNGTFKVPGLRNVELTGPYFHNGAKATLMQVIEAYDAGHHFAMENRSLMSLDIRNLKLTSDEREDLEAFLLTLTDERVRIQSAPFDHPEIIIPFGHPGNQFSVIDDGNGNATQQYIEIPAVGAEGGPPLKPFMKNSFNLITFQNDIQNINYPESFYLFQNFPNPFNHLTKIKYYLPDEGRIRIMIYNSLGELVEFVFNGILPAGNHEIFWNAEKFSSGIYFYKIELVNATGIYKSIIKKMVLLK